MRKAIWRGLAAAMCTTALVAIGATSPAQAAGKTIKVWWNQGFYPAEDQALKDLVAAWEKQSGDKVDLTIYNGSDLPAKIISAMTTGDVPDICYVDNGDFLLLPQAAWNDKVVDVSDVVDTQKSEYSDAALKAANLYDNAAHKRSFFGVPLKQQALHYFAWRPLIEEAGYKDADIPKTWDAYFKFWEDVQTKLRAKGKRIFGLGYSLATKDFDSLYLFNQTLVDYGGAGIVTPDGKLHADDPKVHKAAVDALTNLTTPYKEGFVPPGAINWGDPDNNSAFYAKQIVMTPNATISIPVAQMEKTEQYHARDHHHGAAARAGRQAGDQPRLGEARLHPEGLEERRFRQGLPEIHDRAEEHRRLSRRGARALAAGDAEPREDRSVLDRQIRPAPPDRDEAGIAGPDDAVVPVLQPRLCAT